MDESGSEIQVSHNTRGSDKGLESSASLELLYVSFMVILAERKNKTKNCNLPTLKYIQ